MNRNKAKYVFAFLLGFTFWIPFMIELLNLAPYHLTLAHDGMWGWEINDQTLKCALDGHPQLGSYTGIFGLVLLYGVYICIFASVYVWLVYSEELEVRKKE